MNEQNKNCPCGNRMGSRQNGGACGCNGQNTFTRRPWNSSCSSCGADFRRRNTCGACFSSAGIQTSGDTVWKNTESCCGCGGAAERSNCGLAKQVPRSGGCGEAFARGGCGCGANVTPCARGSEGISALSGKSLAMVYAPKQEFESLYDPRAGLCNGTVFCELNKPFYGSGR